MQNFVKYEKMNCHVTSFFLSEYLFLKSLNAKVAIIEKPVSWFALEVNTLVLIW